MQKIVFIIIILLFVGGFCLYAQEKPEDTNDDGTPDRWVTINAGKVSEIALDLDYNGEIDYIVKYDDNSEKSEEQMDFNFDGRLDDFYYYAGGKLKRREIDSNYDDKIDIWVYLDGIYIEKYEKDTDFDGKIDVVEDYTRN